MKSAKLLGAFLLLASVAIISCKGKTAKDLIINKWKFTELGGKAGDEMPDSVKKQVIESSAIEFKKDGTYEATGGFKDSAQHGTYSLSDDGKFMYSKDSNQSSPDTLKILELTTGKMVVCPMSAGKDGDMKLTLMPK